MFLHKTGTRFKQLMKQRSGSFNDDRSSPIPHAVDDGTPSAHRRDSSWISHAPSVFSAHTPVDEVDVNRLSTAHRLFEATAEGSTSTGNRDSQSSRSSLCSCDGASLEHEHEHEHAHSLFEDKEVLDPPPQISSHVIPDISPVRAFGEVETWKLIFQTNSQSPRHSRASSLASETMEPMSEEKIAVEPELMDDDDVAISDDSDSEHFADNVDQLLRETDLAFQAVGTAIADAKALTQGWKTSEDESRQSSSSSLQRPLTVKPLVLSPQQPSLKSPIIAQTPTTSVQSPSPPSLKSPTSIKSPISLKSPKRRSEKKLGAFLDKPHRRPSPSLPKGTGKDAHPRWTLMEMTANMAEVFSSKIFKQDVDEMLTPARLEKVRKANCTTESRPSCESNESNDVDTMATKGAVELPAVQLALLPSPELPPPSKPPAVPPKSREQLKKAKPTELTLEAKKLSIVEEGDEVEDVNPLKTPEGLAFSGVSFPSPPGLSPSKSSPAYSTSTRSSYLPIIAEGSPLGLDKTFGNWMQVPDSPSSQYINLPSVPHSFVSPCYLQGPIRIVRSHSATKCHDFELEEDEGLDWTAFQVAIAGTLDDTEMWATQEDEVEDLIDWWSGFGFQSYGGMVTATRSKKKSGSGVSAEDVKRHRSRTRSKEHAKSASRRRSRSTGERRERKLAKDAKSPSARSRLEVPATPAPVVKTSDALEKDGKEVRRNLIGGQWEFEYQQGKDVLVWQERVVDPTKLERTKSMVSSVPSMPPSPMMDFKLLQLGTDGTLDSVPMGFNLGHDLGDFLNWETYHVNNHGDE